MPSASKLLFIAVILSVLLLAGCGGSGSTSSATPTTTQLQQVMKAFDDAVGPGLIAKPAGSTSDCTTQTSVVNGVSATVTTCTYSGSFACPGGGSLVVAGTDTTTVPTGSASTDTFQMVSTFSPSNCTADGLTLNGDVSISSNWQIGTSGLVYPATTIEGGEVSFGPKPSGSCQLDVTLSQTSATACSITGSVCGETINQSCSIPALAQAERSAR